MNQKMLAIAAIITAALTGIFSTTPMAAYAGDGDEKRNQHRPISETKEHRKW